VYVVVIRTRDLLREGCKVEGLELSAGAELEPGAELGAELSVEDGITSEGVLDGAADEAEVTTVVLSVSTVVVVVDVVGGGGGGELEVELAESDEESLVVPFDGVCRFRSS
jgi:hypothetical protein